MIKLKILILFVLAFLINTMYLSAQEYSPNQILFKTTRSIEIKRGKTGMAAFDSYLESLHAQAIKPISTSSENRWYSAKVAVLPNWDSVKSNSLRFDGIEIIQPNYLNTLHVTPNDPWYSLQQLNLSELPQAWNYTTGSSMVVVGVVDSGILKEHPDLKNNIYINPNEIPADSIDNDNNGYIDDYCGWDFADAPEMGDVALGDFVGQDNDVNDENFHGTHVSGILGAVSNNGIGIAGACWNVRILPLRAGFRTTSGTGFLQDDDAAAAIIYGADMGCNVMNLSWGDPNYSPIIADACNYAYQKGVTLVASAGNDPGPYLSYPAKLACVISVGAVDQYKNLAGFSSYGPELDLVAPGQQIYSTYKLDGVDMYKEQSGTSMSAPIVTGSIALLKSVLPNLTPDEVRARLLTATDDLGAEGFDIQYGHGLLNNRKLLENISAPVIEVTYPPDNIGLSADFDIIGTIDSEDFFRYTVMCASDTSSLGLQWKDVDEDIDYYYEPVNDNVIAHFQIPPLMRESPYKLRIQYQKMNGDIYNLFRAIYIDLTPPTMVQNSFHVFKRYDGQNIRYYAGAKFSEPVLAELIVYSNNQLPVSCYPSKRDSVQVWQLPNTIPEGFIDIEIVANNSSNLTYHSDLLTNVANIRYGLITDYGFDARVIGNPMVPLNKMYDFDMNGVAEFMAMDLPTSGYGIDKFYEPTEDLFSEKYSYSSSTRFWPLDMGDTNGVGQELLTLNLDTASLYETLPTHTYPDTLIWTAPGISGGIIADYNGDGFKDIQLVQNLPAERVIQLYKRIDATHVSTPKVTLKNTTKTNQRNMFVPTIICQKLDNDNTPDILTTDTDGDIMVFEYLVGGPYNQPDSILNPQLKWTRRIPVSNTYYLTSGDFDGNGTIDFIVGGYNKDVLDPNQTYWFFEGFTSTGNNQYESMGNIQFNQVLSQNAIQSFDVDNDNSKEIILSLSPNLYIIKYIDGEFQPIYFNNSSRTYQIIAWNQDSQPRFITNQNDESDTLRAVLWSKQQPFTGPQTPSNLTVAPLNGTQVSLSWLSSGADSYRVYRKAGNAQSQLLIELSSTSFIDTTVVSEIKYMYSVSAVSNSMSPSESIKTRWVEVIPMPQPIIRKITMIGANELRLEFDQPLSSTSLNPGCYKVDHNIGVPLSVNSVLNQFGVQLRFREVFTDILGSYLIRLQNVTGVTGVAPEQVLYSFSYIPDFTAPQIQWAKVTSSKQSVDICMSESVFVPSELLNSSFELALPANDATNSINSVAINDTIITVTFTHKLKYSNHPYYLTLQNVKDLAGNLITPNQNSCRFNLTDFSNLESIVVYPNPIKVSDYEGVNFLNFPQGEKGKLYIYNSSGDLVYHTQIGPFNYGNNDVTCQWDLTNQAGKQVSSGIYFYMINMGNDTKKGKIAILN